MTPIDAWLDAEGDPYPCGCGGQLERQPGLRRESGGLHPWGTCPTCLQGWTVIDCEAGTLFVQHDQDEAS